MALVNTHNRPTREDLNLDDVHRRVEAILHSDQTLPTPSVRLFKEIVPQNSSECTRKVMEDALTRLRKALRRRLPKSDPEVGLKSEDIKTRDLPPNTTHVLVYRLFIVQAIESPYYVGPDRWRQFMVPWMKEMERRQGLPGQAMKVVLAWVKANEVSIQGDPVDLKDPIRTEEAGPILPRRAKNALVLLGELDKQMEALEDYTRAHPKQLRARRSAFYHLIPQAEVSTKGPPQ